jgi:hypothetical protein
MRTKKRYTSRKKGHAMRKEEYSQEAQRTIVSIENHRPQNKIEWDEDKDFLRALYLDDAKITDISPLSSLPHLKVLELGENLIKDISPLSKIIGLRALRVGKNKIQNHPMCHNCGEKSRTIFIHPADETKIFIGCFLGNREEAIEAIDNKYEEEERDEYIKKVDECFAMRKGEYDK